MKYDEPTYKFYVFVNGLIESGWEYELDALDHIYENLEGITAKPKIIHRSQIWRINTKDNSNWHNQESLKKYFEYNK